MTKYDISSKNPNSHYLQIKVEFEFESASKPTIILPLWRPGRYEEAEYSKNIRSMKARTGEGAQDITRTAKNVWQLPQVKGKLIIEYEYFAMQLDAGASFINDELWLLNPINFLVFAEGYESEECEVQIDLPDNWNAKTTLTIRDNHYFASSYDELIDKPILISPEISEYQYNVDNSKFSLVAHGTPPVDPTSLIPDFKKFTQAQFDLFGDFPFDQYYFIMVFLPYRFYHGVEHSDNTVIVLGVDSDTEKQKFIDDLLGVSSHELFHTWNIKKIRPNELKTYNLKNYTIFDTGLVAEGFTTYYGDLFLRRGDVWSTDRFLQEVNVFLQRHFRNPGRHYSSIVESSEKLWIDGYKPGAPYHKVSIYVKGAIIALMMDLKIRILTNHQSSLDDVMRWLDNRSPESYSLTDIKSFVEETTASSFDQFFTDFIYGIKPVTDELRSLLWQFGLILQEEESGNPLEKYFGIVHSLKEDSYQVEFIDKGSPAEPYLSTGDQIKSIQGKKVNELSNNDMEVSPAIEVEILRLGKKRNITLHKEDHTFMKNYVIQPAEHTDNEQATALNEWLG